MAPQRSDTVQIQCFCWSGYLSNIKQHINSCKCPYIFTIIGQSSSWLYRSCFCWTPAYWNYLYSNRPVTTLFARELESAIGWYILTDCPFLCLRLYRTVQLIWRGFLLERNADSHFAFKNWKTWENKVFCVSFASLKDIITVCINISRNFLIQCFSTAMLLYFFTQLCQINKVWNFVPLIKLISYEAFQSSLIFLREAHITTSIHCWTVL